MLNLEDSTLQFVNNASYDAQVVVEVVPDKEYLLVFQKFAIYVDNFGRRSRSQEMMFPSTTLHFAYSAPYLSAYSAGHVDVFNVNSAEWVQTINVKMVSFQKSPVRVSLKGNFSTFSFCVMFQDLVYFTFRLNRLQEMDVCQCVTFRNHHLLSLFATSSMVINLSTNEY